MTALWTSQDAVLATGGFAHQDWSVSGISIDTRELEAGDLFVALKDVRDGHDFVLDALNKGAAAAMVSKIPDGLPKDAPLLVVDDVLSALEALGMAARERTQAKVIAVTGSVGKTGTKEMLRTALSGQGKTHAAVRSFNNHWGVPLTLARMPQDTGFAVIEIGMNHPGEIGPLSRMAKPDVALITTVAAVHLAAFSSVEEIAKAKAEIFEGLGSNGSAVINADIETTSILAEAAEKVTTKIVEFGTAESADFKLLKAEIIDRITTVHAQLKGQEALFKLAAPGRHLAMNALAAIAAVEAAGGDIANAILALSEFTAPDGRGARQTIHLDMVEDMSFELIDESYNANPTSVSAALDVLDAARHPQANEDGFKGRKIAVLGDMLELGDQEYKIHADLAELEALSKVDCLFTVGPLMRALHEAVANNMNAQWFPDVEELASQAHKFINAGDVVMVKGSNGSQVAKVARALEKLNRD